jgi:hypothetical protein
MWSKLFIFALAFVKFCSAEDELVGDIQRMAESGEINDRRIGGVSPIGC